MTEEELKDHELVDFLREQILRDLRTKSPRIMEAERRSCANIMEGGSANIITIARSWSLYFWRFFKVEQQVSYFFVRQIKMQNTYVHVCITM